jgi:hypothetical protein
LRLTHAAAQSIQPLDYLRALRRLRLPDWQCPLRAKRDLAGFQAEGPVRAVSRWLVSFLQGPWSVNHRWLRLLGRTIASATLVIYALGPWVMSGGAFRIPCAAAMLVFAACSVAYVVNDRHRPLMVSGVVVTFLLFSPVEVSIARRSGL